MSRTNTEEVSKEKVILFIDDEQTILQIVQICIESFSNWTIKIASSCEAGLAEIVMNKPDAILLDMRMPHTDGLTFFKQLQDNTEHAQIPVILFTSCTYETQRQDFTKLGFKGVIDKPFEANSLIPQIASILGW